MVDSFTEWRDKFWRSPAGRAAIESLDAIPGREGDRTALRFRIEMACFCAATYDQQQDNAVQRRRARKGTRRELRRLSIAARSLAVACRRDVPGIAWAIMFATLNTKIVLARRSHSEVQDDDLSVLAAEYLSALANGLEPEVDWRIRASEYLRALAIELGGRLPQVHGGKVFLYTSGNLVYRNPRQAGRQPDVTSMLAFEVVSYLRRFTDHRKGNKGEKKPENVASQVGEPMPRNGKPHYPVAAKFIEAALNVPMAAVDVADRIRRLPDDVLLGRWPHAPRQN